MRPAGPLWVAVERGSTTPIRQDDLPALFLQRLARERWRADSGIHPCRARTHVFIQMLTGTLRLESADGDRLARPGQILAIPEGADYRLWVPAHSDCSHLICNATGPACWRWWQELDRTTPTVLDTNRQQELQHLLEQALDLLASEHYPERWCACLVVQTWQAILAAEQTGVRSPSATDDLARRCRERIDDHFLQPLSVAALAHDFGISPDYLSRSYRARWGRSPSDDLRHRRMQQAADWLTTSDDSIAGIAERLHFSDAFAFSKSFKRWSGLSPRAWRQQFAL